MKYFVFLTFLFFDILSKYLIVQHVPMMSPKWFGYPYGGMGLFETPFVSLSINQVVNSGAVWGAFQGYAGWLFFLRVAIILAMIYSLLFSKLEKGIKLPVCLILTGAIGNGIDYLLYGHVIDFVHFCFNGWSFPVFNFADSYISIGVLFLFWMGRSKPCVA